MRVFIPSVLIVFLLVSAPVHAQLLNVESVRANANTAGWHGELEFDLSLNQYNEQVFEFSNESNLSYFTESHAYMLLNKLKFVNLDGTSLISSGYIHLRSTLLQNERLSPEIFLQYQYNNNLGLNNRALGGAGVKYRFYSTDNWQASISTGLMYEFEEWQLADQPAIKNEFLKTTSNLRLNGKISGDATFLLVGYYQARPDQFFEARSILESKLKMDLSKRIAISISFVASYDAKPIIDIPHWTYELSNGLVVKF
ncbi:MAG: DUF481 domain-containing protein [Gracilimonas sp.]|uniref:DUF481 domain-containing protein n=1 Tax=Gracilimonas sp. TaxID=1974203 RepID=UPI00198C450D|nr:DUF481 domain-containing protein [Gracilimonas sp.]MBD3617367.1 DUF481 domain-containing protein [Gracilimonas sp.]